MGLGDGKGIGCLADNSNFLYLGSLEMHAQSSQLSDSSSGEGTGLTRSSARALEGQEVPQVQVESRVGVRFRRQAGGLCAWDGPQLSQPEGGLKPRGHTLGASAATWPCLQNIP